MGLLSLPCYAKFLNVQDIKSYLGLAFVVIDSTSFVLE